MSTISTGVGLFSGLDYASLVDQLIAIDATPRDTLLTRISNIDAQRTALTDISARIMALLSSIQTLTSPSFFRGATATSSNTDVLSATASDGAMPGAYDFVVRSLATTHQLVSRGFSSKDASVGTGTFTIESALARVDQQTTLEELNGYTGVQRGEFKIIDGDGEEAVISLNDAQTVGDVIDKINAADIGVRAELRDESIVLTDTTDGTAGVRVREVYDGHTAADLGFAPGNTFDAGGELVGGSIYYLDDLMPLSALNDGLGLRQSVAGTDFTIQSSDPSVSVDVELNEIIKNNTSLGRLNHGQGVDLGTIRITTRNGTVTEVDLSEAETVGDVKTAIEDAVKGVSVVLASSDGGRLVITDSTGADDSNLIIEDVDGHAARDLGILGDVDGKKISGSQILHMDTLADVIAAINYGDGNQSVDGTPIIEASIDASGTRLMISDHGSGTFPMTVISTPDGSDSHALEDLGLAVGSYEGNIVGGRIVGGIDTVMLKTLNGGNGLTGGTIRIEANGAGADIDLSEAETLRDVVELINQASEEHGLNIEAGYDKTGTRLSITNLADDGTSITISDLDGNFAESIGLTGSDARIRSDNLQRQYINEATRLDDLNAGRGVALGEFRITDSKGMIGIVDLVEEGAETLQDVIDAINSCGANVEARINDTGDGLVVVDKAGGAMALKITEEGSTTAEDLNILGSSEEGQVDGSYEFAIELNAGDSLSDLVARVNETTLASASLINDGSAAAPYRLSIQSLATGSAGELIVDGLGTDMEFTTLTKAQDASVLLGSSLGGGVLVTSSSNTITDIVDGLTLNLISVDDSPVTVTVGRDYSSMVNALTGMVEDFNSVMKRIDTVSSYNSETETAGVLFGDATLRIVESRLQRAFTTSISGASGTLTRLSQIGVTYEDGKLSFDESKFRKVYDEDPEEVIRFFTTAETGLAVKLEETLDHITESGGLIARHDDALENQEELLSDRVERLNSLLESKRERMLAQFQAMEQTLSLLQTQQSALNSLSSLLSS